VVGGVRAGDVEPTDVLARPDEVDFAVTVERDPTVRDRTGRRVRVDGVELPVVIAAVAGARMAST
jgi:hypothetical protein